MRLYIALSLIVLWGSALSADGAIVKKALGREPHMVARLGEEAGGLEEGAAGWRKWDLGYEVDGVVTHSGRFSARCQNQSVEEHRGLTWVVELDQRVPSPIVAECWSKADGVSEGAAGDYSLYLDLEYADGTPLWGRIAPFDAGTHDWQKRSVTVRPAKPVRRVYVHGIFRRRSGAAWFDDFRLWEVAMPEGTRLFDGIPVRQMQEPARGAPGPSLETDDGFPLRFDASTGAVLTEATGGFCLRDAAGRSDFVRPRGPIQRQPDGSLRWEAEDKGLQLRLSATYRVLGSALRVDGEVQDLSGRDRAVTVYFIYPLEARGWQWHDDQRGARRIEAGREYSNLVEVGAGANGYASRYPLACISGETEALAIAAPLDLPRLCRFGYSADSRELYAAFDLGLSADTLKFPSRASFSLVLYRPDPAWGFRSALERYYQLFPDCFTKRNLKEGIWMPFTDIASVEGFQDFGFQFKEGDNNVAFDDEQGIYSFVYVEPWSLWLRMPKDMERTHGRARALIESQAADGQHDAQAALSSAILDAQGRWVGQITTQPWCDGAVYALNPSPHLRAAGPGGITQFEHEWGSIERAFARSAGLDGTYIDSFEIYMAANALNYRREHFAQTETPLVFDQEGRIAVSEMFGMVEFAKEIAARMWAEGKMTFANGTPYDCPWGAAWLDVMGTEYNWARSGEYAPPPDELLNCWRALSYQRPYLLLLNTDFHRFPREWVERYMKRCAAYGLFPSMFSHNAADDPYWRDPDLYNRDRELFRKYVPLISRLSAAGWEPVTQARSDDPKVYVERFGRPGGPLYLTVFNDGAEGRRARILFDAPLLQPGAGALEAIELLSGRPVSGKGGALELEIGAQDVKVLALHGSE